MKVLEMVSKDQVKIYCGCSEYFHIDYFGECEECGNPTCYECALGGGDGNCNKS